MTTRRRFLASVLPTAHCARRGEMSPDEWWRSFLWMAGSFMASWIFAFVAVRMALWDHPEGSYVAPAVALALASLAGLAVFLITWHAQSHQGAEPYRPGPPVPRRLLIIEDEPALARGYEHLFKLDGWEVLVARTMTEGLLRLYELPEWVWCDIMLPDGSGAEVVRAVRNLGFACRVVVASGLPREEVLRRLAGEEADIILTKGSINVAELSRRMAGGGDDGTPA